MFASSPVVNNCISDVFEECTLRIEFDIPDHIMIAKFVAIGMFVIFVFNAINLMRLSSCAISVTALCDIINVCNVGILMLEILLQFDTSKSVILEYIEGIDDNLVLAALIDCSEIG
tara:strand:- start:287 stop:634 length:348 start_codon:yes stop_codon:yes gene_type:complete